VDVGKRWGTEGTFPNAERIVNFEGGGHWALLRALKAKKGVSGWGWRGDEGGKSTECDNH